MDEQVDRLDLVIKQVFDRMKKLNTKPAACPADEILAAYLTGSLTQKERQRIEEHLVLCEKCTETLISFSQTESSYQPTDKTFTTEKMVKKAKGLIKPREKQALWEKVSAWFPVFRPVPILVAASILLAVVVFGIYNLYEPSLEMPPSVKLHIIARMPSEILIRGTTPDYREIEIQDGGELHSGDMFRIKFELQEEAYVYLLSLDSLGNITKLFPETDTGLPVKFKPHETNIFPEKEKWLRLDKNTGQEALYLLASPEVIRNIDQRIDLLRKSGIDNITKIFLGVKIQSFSFRHK
jgi:hypothetical protein